MAQARCKSHYDKHINSQPPSKDRVLNLWKDTLTLCTADFWTKCIEHCEKLIKDDWTRHMGECIVNDIL
jgi:hypothetical protein